jgi:hypothetical protein
MGLNVGVRHKNTTLPNFFTVQETNTDRIQFGLNVGVRHRKLTLPHSYSVPNTDRTQLIPGISVSLLKKTVRKKPKELKVRLNKKSFRKSESSYEKMSLDHITVKTTDEYETQTDNSDSPSENKTDKIYEHKTYQSRIENLDAFTTTTEINKFLIV